MRKIVLKTVATDFLQDRVTGQALAFRIDAEAYDARKHTPQLFHYKDTLRSILNYIPTDGAGRPANSPEEYDDAIRLLRELKKLSHGATWLLEEKDHAFLSRRTTAYPFSLAELWLADFRADVVDAPKVEMVEAGPVGGGVEVT